MPWLARIHGHSYGHGGGRPLVFVTLDPSGHLQYHLESMLIAAGVTVVGLFVLYSVIFKPDYARTTTPGGCLVGAGVVLGLIALTCAILLHFPAFVWS